MRMKFSVAATLAIFAFGVALPTASYAQSCRALRFACENKETLGLEGAGMCRQYREQCGSPREEWDRGEPRWREERRFEERRRERRNCERLRYRCEHKEELGLEGAGTCRQYRSACGEEY